MFVGWVRTHLRVVLGDVYGLFWVFELDFWKNGQMSKIWAFSGALRRGVGTPRRGEAEWEAGQASGSLRRSHCSQHEKFRCFVSFCLFVAPMTRLLD